MPGWSHLLVAKQHTQFEYGLDFDWQCSGMQENRQSAQQGTTRDMIQIM